MQKITVFKKPVHLHQPQNITHICTSPGCTNRIICDECVNNHLVLHSDHLVALSEALSSTSDAEYQETLLKIENYESTRLRDIHLVETFFEKLEIKIVEILQALKANYLEKLNEELTSKLYEQLKADFDSIKDQFNSKNKDIFAERFTTLYDFKTKLENSLPKLPAAFKDDKFFESFNIQDYLVNQFTSFISTPVLESRFLRIGTPSRYQTKPKLRIFSPGRTPQRPKNEFRYLWALNANNLQLEDDKTRVRIISTCRFNYQAVVGNKLLKQGIHKWSFRFGSDTGCSAGIVSQYHVGDLDCFDWSDAYYLSGNGFAYNLKSTIEEESLKFKVMDVVLDLDMFKIEIYNEEKLIAYGPIARDYYYLLGFFAPNTTYGYIELIDEKRAFS